MTSTNARSWALLSTAFLLAVAALLLNHERVRLVPLLVVQPWLHLVVVGLFALTALVFLAMTLRRKQGAPYRRTGVVKLGLSVAIAIVALTGAFFGYANWGSSRLAQSASATVAIDHAHAELFIDGQITPRLVEELALAWGAAPAVKRLSIRSLGGEISSAQAIGRIIRDKEVPVRIVDRCASACALIWASSPSRQMNSDALLGIHLAHRGDNTPGAGLTAVATDAHSKTLLAALKEAGISESLLSPIVTREQSLLWVTAKMLIDDGVEVTVTVN